jgi:hypothetical protein
MATIGGSNIVTSGLVLSLDAANSRSYPGSGTTWFDLSGNSNNGTLTNGPTFDSANNGSIDFDSTDDYVQFSNIASFDSSAFTIDITLLLEENLSTAFYGFFSTISTNAGYQLFWHNGQYFYLFVTNTIVVSTSSTPGTIPSGTYLNLVATYDSSSLSNTAIYVNNTRYAGSNIGTYVAPTLAPRLIGRRADVSTDYHLNCKVYSTRFYNRSLTASEVQQNYNAQKSRLGL